MNGYLRIGGALLMGTFIVLGTLLVSHNSKATEAQTAAALQAIPSRTYIEPKDSDGNGVEDWKEAIAARAIDTIKVSRAKSSTSTKPYTPPTTLTGKFSEAFFADYLSQKSAQGGEAVDTTVFVNETLEALKSSTKDTIYTARDFTVIPDSLESLHEYGNAVATVLLSDRGGNEHELMILERALTTKDPKELEKLAPIEAAYKRVAEDLLATPVPASLVEVHTGLVTLAFALHGDIVGMTNIFNDPLYGLLRIQQFQSNSMSLMAAAQSGATKLIAKGITYADDEPGSIIYTLDL